MGETWLAGKFGGFVAATHQYVDLFPVNYQQWTAEPGYLLRRAYCYWDRRMARSEGRSGVSATNRDLINILSMQERTSFLC